MNITFLDHPDNWQNLLPLTYTRPIPELRLGILTLKEKWQRKLNSHSVSYITEDYLGKKYPFQIIEDGLIINSSILPDKAVEEYIRALEKDQILLKENKFIAARTSGSNIAKIQHEDWSTFSVCYYKGNLKILKNVWELFQWNGQEIINDFELITKNRYSSEINDHYTRVYGPGSVFIEEGAVIKCAILNAESGPIYIGKNCKISENAVIQGPTAICEESTVSIGAKIRKNNTVGPACKIGGEVSNSVIFGYSNKSHDGYLGNSVLGEWCNLGADTNTSNMKNNYGNVKVWNYPSKSFININNQFCGLIMGDHAKSGINTMFNTGTVCGVSSNIFGGGFPKKFIPSFSWGDGSTYIYEKALEVAEKMMARRNIQLPAVDVGILENVYRLSKPYRNNQS
ncbi:MAG TPA: putative sugar nucleotidyl transferase [Cyclobacteriaceae bacterium]